LQRHREAIIQWLDELLQDNNSVTLLLCSCFLREIFDELYVCYKLIYGETNNTITTGFRLTSPLLSTQCRSDQSVKVKSSLMPF